MAHNLKYKDIEFKSFKEDGNSLIIEGYGATFGNVDAGGDVIQRGAFTKTLMEQSQRIAFCYQHEIYEPIGKIQLIKEDETGLFIQVRISESEDKIITKIKEGILKEMSIGYRVINAVESIQNEKPIYTLTEIKLYEISLVTRAMNEKALITGMKSDEQKDYLSQEFERLIVTERNHVKKYDLMKLKNTVLALIEIQPEKTTEKNEKPPITAKEILTFLNN